MASRRKTPTQAPAARTRPLTVIAQDPGVRAGGQILTTQLEVPIENLSPGPMGVRLHVIDYDASTGTLYKALPRPMEPDPYAGEDSERLLTDPRFHQQNVYAIATWVLGRFERALGRRVTWSFPYGGHPLKIDRFASGGRHQQE